MCTLLESEKGSNDNCEQAHGDLSSVAPFEEANPVASCTRWVGAFLRSDALGISLILDWFAKVIIWHTGFNSVISVHGGDVASDNISGVVRLSVGFGDGVTWLGDREASYVTIGVLGAALATIWAWGTDLII